VGEGGRRGAHCIILHRTCMRELKQLCTKYGAKREGEKIERETT
jgi:hypothetical protein